MENLDKIKFYSKLSGILQFNNIDEFTEYLIHNDNVLKGLYHYEPFVINNVVDTREYGQFIHCTNSVDISIIKNPSIIELTLNLQFVMPTVPYNMYLDTKLLSITLAGTINYKVFCIKKIHNGIRLLYQNDNWEQEIKIRLNETYER